METEDVYSIQAKITQQQSLVKEMKKNGAAAADILAEVTKMNDLRAVLAKMNATEPPQDAFNRKAFDELILRKMYIVQSFEIHNGPAGLFDYGPPACALKANVLQLWRRHFALEDNMLEMECTNLTPSSVLETSGHVERFTDFMVKDEITGECFRADKLLEDVIDALLLANPNMPIQEQEAHKIIQRQADAFSADELHDLFQKYNVKSPANGVNNLTRPFPFNLMFKTTIGPEGTSVGYLRPETAQGLFVNFRRLLDYNQQKMPFAAAQIGLGFRNEIAPRNGLLRVREFTMAEIEHFVNPNDKRHPKFKRWAHVKLCLFPAEAQLSTGRTVVMSIGEAVSQGIVNNETLGYFMTRTQLWAEKVGVNPAKMRFRQHLKTEMAHYAADCWDLEVQMSYGWIECAGHADRACYDLQQHSNRTGVPLVASERLAEPVLVEKWVCEPNKKLVGPRFKGAQKEVIAALEALDGDELQAFKTAVESQGKASLKEGHEITADLVSFKMEKKTISEVKYTPSVIEPSFGVGRILYAVLEHAFSQREGDEQRCVMAFKPCVAPIKVGIYRLINHAPFDAVVSQLRDSLQAANIANKVDSSAGTVGRRYSRADELGIPFGITVDFQTLLDNTVTVRDRDTTAQIRLPISQVVGLIRDLAEETVSWAWVMTRYRVVATADSSAAEGADEQEAAAASAAAAKVDTTSPVILEYTSRGSFTRPNPNYKPK